MSMVTTLTPSGSFRRGSSGLVPRRPEAHEKESRILKVTVMKECSTPAQIKACRALALERNRQLFENAHALNRAANALLEVENLDFEQFERYRALRKKADFMFEDAIDHLCVLNEDFPPIPMSSQNSQALRRELATAG
jgi:hypothetical protein